MENKNNQSKKNTWAAGIGFALILLAIFASLGRSYFSKIMNSPKAAPPSQNSSEYKSLSVQALFAKTQSSQAPAMLDVRDPDPFAAEHIIDSKNIGQQELSDILSSSDKNKSYCLIDDLGPSPIETKVMDAFSQAGFKNVSYLKGGLTEWKNELDPTITAGDPYSFTDQAKVNYISSDDLKKIMAGENDLYIIDVRTAAEFATGHMPGAVNITLADLEAKRGQIPLGKKIILYDNDSIWAFQGAVRLFDMGTLNVFALSDGYNTWTQKGYPVTK
ncbi:MAG: rhodanese-like domain-containing protein [Candidatus Pacebacteria bacterium]|nr:rhodanese-like domain-containing protein [Candidatus Paceibacterota bacterium]MDR3582816.1 rhodanese-like domain-containing protein [Candidatus Paceibacterota bacterium]